MSCVGQIFMSFAWVTCVKIFFMWVNILHESLFLRGLCGSNIFLRGSNFFWVSLCVGQNFLRGSKVFVLVNFHLLDEII